MEAPRREGSLSSNALAEWLLKRVALTSTNRSWRIRLSVAENRARKASGVDEKRPLPSPLSLPPRRLAAARRGCGLCAERICHKAKWRHALSPAFISLSQKNSSRDSAFRGAAEDAAVVEETASQADSGQGRTWRRAIRRKGRPFFFRSKE